MSTTMQQASRAYAHISAVTAGHLKSHQILLERTFVLMRRVRKGDLEARNRIQDIIAQLQSSLELRYDAAQNLFKVFGHTWDALEWNEPIYLDRAEDLLRQMHELVVEIQRK